MAGTGEKSFIVVRIICNMHVIRVHVGLMNVGQYATVL
jgi:hypothetical protein